MFRERKVKYPQIQVHGGARVPPLPAGGEGWQGGLQPALLQSSALPLGS